MNLLELKCDNFSSLFQAESQFQNSNVGGKKLAHFQETLPLVHKFKS